MGTTAIAVCVNVTGDPLTPASVAVTVTAPGVEPSVCTTWAKPSESVEVVALLTLPPPLVTANVTGIERTPSESAALTRTRRASGSAVPTVPVWPLPLTSEMIAGTGCDVTFTVSACPVSVAAMTFVIPRAAPPPSLPPYLLLILTLLVSSDVHATSVPGRAPPAVSFTSAVSVMESPKATAVSCVTVVTVLAASPGPV